MAKARKNIVQVAKGTFWRLVKGERKDVPTVGEALQHEYSCCGPDCCNNIYRWIDKDTGTTYVEYVLAGSKVLETEAAYLVKVGNGDFTY